MAIAHQHNRRNRHRASARSISSGSGAYHLYRHRQHIARIWQWHRVAAAQAWQRCSISENRRARIIEIMASAITAACAHSNRRSIRRVSLIATQRNESGISASHQQHQHIGININAHQHQAHQHKAWHQHRRNAHREAYGVSAHQHRIIISINGCARHRAARSAHLISSIARA